MAVYERSYHGYDGELTGTGNRILVISKFTTRELFRSRMFCAFFAICFVPSVSFLIAIYLRYNLEMLTELQIPIDEIFIIDAGFFINFLQYPQASLSFLLALVVGPGMISPDLRDNAMPLYLSRALTKTDYLLGKLLVLVVLLSLITWVPAVLLFFIHAYLGPEGWLVDNLQLPFAFIVTSFAWIFTLSLTALALSAWIKWKQVAQITFFGFFVMSSALGEAVREIFGGWLGSAFSAFDSYAVLISYAANEPVPISMPPSVAIMNMLVLSALATALIFQRIRAKEVA
jgi:ABC-2 type transport system permease protein